MDKKIVCTKCGWNWKESETEEHDKYVCHKCGNDMTKMLSENRELILKTVRKILNNLQKY
jgi:Zn finger protein HypA/HybF involved in hydrogenase expression